MNPTPIAHKSSTGLCATRQNAILRFGSSEEYVIRTDSAFEAVRTGNFQAFQREASSLFEHGVSFMVYDGAQRIPKSRPIPPGFRDVEKSGVGWTRIATDINSLQKDGFNLLEAAAGAGQLEMVNHLISKKVRVNRSQFSMALQLAAMNGHMDVLEPLKNAGAILDGTDLSREKSTPLHFAVQGVHPACVEKLIALGADKDKQDGAGNTPLMLAVKHQKAGVIDALLAAKSDPDIIDQHRPPLNQALLLANLDIAQKLLDAGAKTDTMMGRFESILEPLITQVNDASAAAFIRKNSLSGVPEEGKLHMVHTAIQCNKPEILKALIEKNININVSYNPDETPSLTPLVRAVQGGNLEIVKILCNANADQSIRHEDKTLLQWAMAKNHERIAQYFLNPDAPAKPQDDAGAAELRDAIQKGLSDLATQMLEQKPELAGIADTQTGVLPAHTAAYKGDGKRLSQLLKLHPASKTAKDHAGQSLLHYAVRGGHAHYLAKLARIGNGINDQTKDTQRTPLHLAAFEGKLSCIEELLKLGADTTLADGRGDTALDLTIRDRNFPAFQLLINRSPMSGNLLSAITPLGSTWVDAALKAGCDVNTANHVQRNPLHLAVLSSDLSSCESLLQRGLNPFNSPDKFGKTPFELAWDNKNGPILRRFIENADSVTLDAFRINSEFGLVYHAAKLGDVPLLEQLIRKGCNPQQMHQGFYTPLLTAIHEKKPAAIAYLLTHGYATLDENKGQTMESLIRTQNLEVLKFLENQGLINIKTYRNPDGKTLKDLAIIQKAIAMTQYLNQQ